MSLANSRDQRSTAGNRMSKLLDAEEEDEFYKTTYGGFNDVSLYMCVHCIYGTVICFVKNIRGD